MCEEFDGGYQGALLLAGAEVLAFECFGSYQGDWLAKVRINGQIRWVHDYFGSCSYCDAFEHDLGGKFEHSCADNRYHNPVYRGFTSGCAQCQKAKEAIGEFGKRYLEDAVEFDEVRSQVVKNAEWDMDAQKMVTWLDEHR